MKSKPCVFYFVFVIGIFHTVFILTAGGANKIMPLGDSITQGNSSGVADEEFQVSYRKALYDRLKAAGYVVDNEIFVGSLFSGEWVANFDPDHEGHPGWRADEIVAGRAGSVEGNLAEWLITEKPDIILLHIGTNDISFSNEDWNEVEAILAVIDNYESTSGNSVWVILSRIINRSCDPFVPPCPKSLETSNFNDNIENFVFFPRQIGGDKIVLVDMQNNAGINYDRWQMGGDMWDTLHPFETGYDKMADLWFAALLDILPRANAGLDQRATESGTVTLDASESRDPKNGNLSYRWLQTAGTRIALSDNRVAQPTFVAPEVGSDAETLKFRLTVTDTDGLESTDTVSIDVLFSDNCPNDPDKIDPGICGCGVPDIDSDGDGISDCNDGCPADSGKTQPGVCGCGAIDTDTDHDGAPDCVDNCPNHPDKIDPGICGCDVPDIDSDGDGISDCNDGCPADSGKTQPGVCGCGAIDTDTDHDGAPDCVDNCPNDPGKINPGICGCRVSDTDIDSDGLPDCSDGCPADSRKTQPGECGCGVSDTDADNDGTPDCIDNCPNDSHKSEMGICGCGIADEDADGDGAVDCPATSGDNDGAPDTEEQGPDGDDPSYDGNEDGIADWLQNNVTSFHTFNDRSYVTIESPDGTSIGNVNAVANPAAASAPPEVSFPDGFFEFKIFGVSKGGSTTVRLHFPVGSTFNTYYKFGPTINNLQNHWYEFLYSGQTGAEIDGNIITLNLVDGLTGDDDLIDDGIIIDIGAPGNIAAAGDVSNDPGGSIGENGGSGGGGGGGCLIATAADGIQASNGTLTLMLLWGLFVAGISVLELQKKRG